MGKNKLARFEQNLTFKNMVQLPESMKGKWHSFFGNLHPITLELACGHGAYTVGLARMHPERNFIGIDRKGARMWRGAKDALAEGLHNAAFLRIQIDHCDEHFDTGEVDQIWITFPDPHPGKDRKKLTSPLFINRYKKFLKPGGSIHLKTDDEGMFDYTLSEIERNGFKVQEMYRNVYTEATSVPELMIKTYYEMKWLEMGKTIRYVRFTIS